MKAEEVLRKYEEWYRGNYNDDTVILHPFYVEKFLGELTEEDEEVSGEFAKDKSIQPMKDFGKEFFYNWTIEAIKDNKDLFYRVQHWIGEWYENNVSKFSR